MATDSAIPFAELSTRSSLHSTFHLPMNKIIWTAQLPGQDLKTSWLFVSLEVLDCKIIAWLTSLFDLVPRLFSLSENDRTRLMHPLIFPAFVLLSETALNRLLSMSKGIPYCQDLIRTAAFFEHCRSICNPPPAFIVLAKPTKTATLFLKPSSMKFGNEEQFAKTANRIGLY